jgi:hypothetical protein
VLLDDGRAPGPLHPAPRLGGLPRQDDRADRRRPPGVADPGRRQSIGLRRQWFQPDYVPAVGGRPAKYSVPGGWHYDVTAPKRAEAVRRGAVEIDVFDLVETVISKPGRETQRPDFVGGVLPAL